LLLYAQRPNGARRAGSQRRTGGLECQSADVLTTGQQGNPTILSLAARYGQRDTRLRTSSSRAEAVREPEPTNARRAAGTIAAEDPD
jgi:hypothetical protein